MSTSEKGKGPVMSKLKSVFHSEDIRGPPFLLSARFFMALLAFSAYMIQYMQKIMVSVAIVCMVNNTWVAEQKLLTSTTSSGNLTLNSTDISNTTAADPCFFKTHHSAVDGTLKWTKDVQGLVLASFFWGYIITEVPGGWLATRFGPRIVLFIAFMISSTLTLLLPVSARAHYGAFIFLRIIIGAATGVLWPGIAALWSQWAPPTERSRLIGIGNSGSQIGNVIALPLGSYLCSNGFDEGWGSIYYIFGIISIVWCFIWVAFSADSPASHKLITKNEKAYIIEVTKESASVHAEHESLKDAPWKEIMTSIPCISFYVTLTFNNWGTYTFLTNIPTYMKEVLKFDIKSNLGLAAIPYLLFWFFIIISGNIADKIISKNKIPKTYIRKFFNATSNYIPMCAVIGLVFIDCTNPYGGLALLCLGLAFTGTGYGAGFMVNANEIAGNYAGVVFGVSNTFATIPGIIAPYVVGVLTPNSLQSEWRNVFIITAVIYFVGGTQALFFTSADLQPWARHSPTERKSLKLSLKGTGPSSVFPVQSLVIENKKAQVNENEFVNRRQNSNLNTNSVNQMQTGNSESTNRVMQNQTDQSQTSDMKRTNSEIPPPNSNDDKNDKQINFF